MCSKLQGKEMLFARLGGLGGLPFFLGVLNSICFGKKNEICGSEISLSLKSSACMFAAVSRLTLYQLMYIYGLKTKKAFVIIILPHRAVIPTVKSS